MLKLASSANHKLPQDRLGLTMKLKLFLSLLLFAYFFVISVTKTFAATCELAKIEPDSSGQRWDVTYCVSSSNTSEITAISNITATCRSAPGGIQNCDCHSADWYDSWITGTGAKLCGWEDLNPFNSYPPATSNTQSVSPQTVTDASGNTLTCFTLTSLDRNMGSIDVEIKNASGNLVCPTQSANVTPGNYGGPLEYFQNTIATRIFVGNSAICADGRSINTALGCIPYDASGFVKSLLGILIGLGGGVALVIILYGVFIVTTSAGIPDKLNQGKELISSAVGGLVFIILAIFLMNLIGIRILALPGLE